LAKDKISVLYYKLETENIKTICLIEQPNVHLFYYTAWTGINNTMQFREDIYKLDKPLIEQLKKD
jgi:murein L,D-transpeptidase YcbB/YkuD